MSASQTPGAVESIDLAARVRSRKLSLQSGRTSSPDPKRPERTTFHSERPSGNDDFRIAIFCALAQEAAAVRAILDHCWDTDASSGAPFEPASGDRNSYTSGVVGEHHVVIVHMPGMGKSRAAQAAADCLHTFRNIELALLVGICGGVPSGSRNSVNGAKDIFLGDVIVSEYVVQHDFGRKLPDGLRVKKTGVDMLERPNAKICSCISKIKSDTTIETTTAALLSTLGGLSAYPGASNDKHFAPTYRHKHQDPKACFTCAECIQRTDPACDEAMDASCAELGCDESNLMVRRRPFPNDGSQLHAPSIHYGTFASGDVVMRSGEDRDDIAKSENAMGFEMEAPGLWQSFPGRTIIVKGVCDYADSHKNKLWQNYASATAAAYMKVFLSHWTSGGKQATRAATDVGILQDEKSQKCLSDLRLTDPSIDKRRIEKTKGGLFWEASTWILEHHDYRQWLVSEDTRLLWIKGDPGKGKTMLIITVIDELERRVRQLNNDNGKQPGLITYFFCQGTSKDLNHGIAVLRGLIYLLVRQHPPLISYLRAIYDHAGARLFEDSNAFFALSEILQNMLGDHNRPAVYLVVDALDECWEQQGQLLEFVSDSAAKFSRAKWIVASRNVPEIERHFTLESLGIKMILEIQENAEQIAQAVNAYIDFQVDGLPLLTQDDPQRIQVRDILREKANGTFLWVALAIKQVRNAEPWSIIDDLQGLPRGLDDLYAQMLAHIQNLPSSRWELCQRMLSAVVLAYRPLHVTELGVLSEMPQSIRMNTTYLRSVVSSCGSFLTIQNDDTVYILHQSATDYLNSGGKAVIFPGGHAVVHRNLYIQSLKEMMTVLKQNIYNLPHPGASIEEAQITEDPLLSVRYSAIYWVDHFEQSPRSDDDGSHDVRVMYAFFETQVLGWFEALCVIQELPVGILALAKLKRLLMDRPWKSRLLALVHDALRFLQYFKVGMMVSPLQIYASGLLFSPKNSLIRKVYQGLQPDWIQQPPEVSNDWSICEHILEGHSDEVNEVAFSPDGKMLVSASWDHTIRIWRTDTGVCEQVLKDHTDAVMSVAYSPDGFRIASRTDDGDLMLWSAASGPYRCERLLMHGEAANKRPPRGMAFSPDGHRFAASLSNEAVQLWRLHGTSFVPEQTLSKHRRGTVHGWQSTPTNLTFSPDSRRLAVVFRDGLIEVWRADDGALYKFERDLKAAPGYVPVAFSSDGVRMALGSTGEGVRIVCLDSGLKVHSLKAERSRIRSLAFSPDGKWLICGSRRIYAWSVEAGSYTLERTLQGALVGEISSLAFSPDSAWFASASLDNVVRVWRTDTASQDHDVENEYKIISMTFSPDGLWLAAASTHGSVRIWNVETRVCERTIHHPGYPQVVFSENGLRLVCSSTASNTISLWLVHGWIRDYNIDIGFIGSVNKVAFSLDGAWLAAVYSGSIVKIFHTDTGVCKQELDNHHSSIEEMAFSPNSARLALTSQRNYRRSWTTRIWCLDKGTCVQKLHLLGSTIGKLKRVSFSPNGQQVRLTRSTMRNFADGVPEVYYGGFDVSEDRRWITWSGIPILWLPPDYDGECSAISGSCIALGLYSGQVITLALDPQRLNELVGGINVQYSRREEWEKSVFDVSLQNDSLVVDEDSDEEGGLDEEGGSNEEGEPDEERI